MFLFVLYIELILEILLLLVLCLLLFVLYIELILEILLFLSVVFGASAILLQHMANMVDPVRCPAELTQATGPVIMNALAGAWLINT